MTGTRARRSFTPELDEANIFVWDGNYYALEVTRQLGLEDSGGMVRGTGTTKPVVYNPLEEIKKYGEAL